MGSSAKKGSKRLNIALDPKTFAILDRIKERHGDTTYTQAIKRSIALLDFIDKERAKGNNIYLGRLNKESLDDFLMVVFPH